MPSLESLVPGPLAHSRPRPQTRAVTSMARYGLGSQALVYLLLAWLTFEIAVRGGSGSMVAVAVVAVAAAVSRRISKGRWPR